MRVKGVVAALVLSALVAGCSGDDDDDSAGEEASEASEATAPEPEVRGSAGCGTSDVAAGEEKVTLTSDGEERWYLQHVPPAHDGEEPVPVVLDIHGYSEGAEIHASMTGLGGFGDEEGFVTVTPHAIGIVPFWATALDSPDVAFMGEVLDQVEADLCVDLDRIYVTGLSNGAMMTSAVSCALADRIAAAAPVAGVMNVPDCDPERPVAAVVFHGTEDPFLDYDGGFGPAVANLPSPDGQGTLGDMTPEEQAQANETVGASEDALSVPEVSAAWAERNGCEAAEPEESSVAEDVMLLTWECPAGAEVELYRVEGGGHTWPGSPFLEDAVGLVGTTTFSIEANQVMWDFFTAHPLAADQ